MPIEIINIKPKYFCLNKNKNNGIVRISKTENKSEILLAIDGLKENSTYEQVEKM